jgi:chromosome segregation protein
VDAAHQTAIAAALDAATRHVVVEQGHQALEGLRLVQQREAPRVVFAALTGGDGQAERAAVGFAEQAAAALGELPGWRLAVDLVGAEPAHQALYARYLGATVVVDTLAHALVVYDRLLAWPGRTTAFQVVTDDGAVLRSAGEWAAGRDGRDAHLLAYQREALALDAALAEAETVARAAGERLAAAERAVAAAAVAESAAREALGGADVAARDAEHARRMAAHELDAAGRELARHDADLARETQAQERLTADLAQADAALAAARAADAERGAARAGAREALVAAEQAAQAAGAEQAAAEQALAVASADARAARDLAQRAAGESTRLAAEQQASRQQAAEAEQAIAELTAQAERAERRLAASVAEAAPLQAEQHTLQDAAADAAEARARLDEQARRLQRDLRAADEACAAATIAAERAADALATLRRERTALLVEIGLAEEAAVPVQLALAADGDGVPSPPTPLPGGEGLGVREPLVDLDDLRRRLAARQRELRAVGAVDVSALEDYRAAVERQEFAAHQIADLAAASAALRAAGAELQARMRQRFQETFAAVAAAFADCFHTLFGGGAARLELTAGEDALSAGVEVIAQPPGKRAHSLHTLSGGERALTAVALLFGLLRVQPSPFCILDEVDAALDETNVQRFCQLLRAQAAHTQFLVITHNRGTMETANALYGVTMVDSAISQVLSLRLGDLPASGAGPVVH